jgi:hypothetical protein
VAKLEEWVAKLEGWLAKLEGWLAKLVARLLATASCMGFESTHPLKIINGRQTVCKGVANTL